MRSGTYFYIEFPLPEAHIPFWRTVESLIDRCGEFDSLRLTPESFSIEIFQRGDAHYVAVSDADGDADLDLAGHVLQRYLKTFEVTKPIVSTYATVQDDSAAGSRFFGGEIYVDQKRHDITSALDRVIKICNFDSDHALNRVF